ncbi:MAG: hypothetical protein JSS79_08540 [Bacteroidetes bacterium]|nr:hypothetical protein [Bacteroidota bacterium]
MKHFILTLFSVAIFTLSFGQNQWYGLSSTPNTVTLGPFQFTVKKLTIKPVDAKKKTELAFDDSKNNLIEVEYEIKNTSSQRQEIKGVYRFPVLYNKNANTDRFDPMSASYGAYYLDGGFSPKDPAVKKEYDAVVKSAFSLNDAYDPGAVKTVRYFMYAVPKTVKNLVFWITPTGCSNCGIQLKTGEAAGCEIKL